MRLPAAISALFVVAALTAGGGGDDAIVNAGRPPASIAKRLPDPFAPSQRQLPGTFVGATGGKDYVGFVVSDGQAAV
jgi:hypothetical protein